MVVRGLATRSRSIENDLLAFDSERNGCRNTSTSDWRRRLKQLAGVSPCAMEASNRRQAHRIAFESSDTGHIAPVSTHLCQLPTNPVPQWRFKGKTGFETAGFDLDPLAPEFIHDSSKRTASISAFTVTCFDSAEGPGNS
jgi:hypothetical protein